MIVGIGTDIVHTHLFHDKSEHKLSKWFTENEIEYCESKHFPHRHYAARWAAKEACLKALGLAMADGMKNVEVCRSVNGKPLIELHGIAREKTSPDLLIHVSISHTGECATACVVVERN